MALAASPSTCVSLQAFPVESTRRTTRAVSGNAAVSISFVLGSSAFFGERIQLGQGLKPSLAPTGGKGINAQSTTAQFYNDGGQNGSLQTDDSSPAWNSDPAAKFSSYYPYAGHPSAVAGTADYALSQNELYGNRTGSPHYVSTPLQQTVGEDKILVDSKVAANDDGLAISALGINPEIVKALADKGISHLFPIQRAVFEPAMQGKDLIGRAKTGTGKTLAFGIPIVDRILQVRKQERKLTKGPSALVLAPTRELAKQVEKEFMTAAPSLSTVCVYGGVPIMSQQRLLSRGVDVAVGTPGRIIDLIERGSLDLKTVQYVVLDEADQMLAVEFEEDVEKIMEQLPQCQNMLFSATMPTWVQRISGRCRWR